NPNRQIVRTRNRPRHRGIGGYVPNPQVSHRNANKRWPSRDLGDGMNCPNCGAEFPAGAASCPACGAPRSEIDRLLRATEKAVDRAVETGAAALTRGAKAMGRGVETGIRAGGTD